MNITDVTSLIIVKLLRIYCYRCQFIFMSFSSLSLSLIILRSGCDDVPDRKSTSFVHDILMGIIIHKYESFKRII